MLRTCLFALLLSASTRSVRAAELGSIGDFTVRLDLGLRFSLGLRLLNPDPALLTDVNADDGDRAFAPGPISERLDFSTRLDVTRGGFGVTFGIDGWYDAAYHGADANRSPTTFNPVTVANRDFPADVTRLMGDTVELGDTFVHDRIDLAGVPVTLRIGRQTLTWGESLFFAQDGIAGAQAPVDTIKLAAQPLVEAREVFLPVTAADLRIGLPGDLSLELYDQLEWRRDRIPGVTSYFSTTDILDTGGQRVFLPGGGSLSRGSDDTPGSGGQFGIALRRDIDRLGLGLYALRYSAHAPEAELGAAPGTYRLAFPSGIDLLGISANGYLGTSTIAGEVSYRRNVPLASRFQPLAPGIGIPGTVPPGYATGETLQLLISTDTQLASGRFWNAATIEAELVTGGLLHVRSGASARLPGTTGAAAAFEAVFTPTYYRVAPNLDLSVPVGFEVGVAGRSPTDAGLNAGTGNLTLGLAATYRAVWVIGLSATHYLGRPADQPLADRDFVGLSVGRTF